MLGSQNEILNNSENTYQLFLPGFRTLMLGLLVAGIVKINNRNKNLPILALGINLVLTGVAEITNALSLALNSTNSSSQEVGTKIQLFTMLMLVGITLGTLGSNLALIQSEARPGSRLQAPNNKSADFKSRP